MMPHNKLAGTVLIVDDDAMVRYLLSRVLERKGYTTRVASDGAEASELFRQIPDDIGLLLTDMAMPRKNGLELANEVKALRPDLPILLMSGNFGENFGECKVGIDRFPRLQKPFPPDALLREVGKYMQSAEFGSPGAAQTE